MALWLLAVAYQAAAGPVLLPRRLVWVVNRRVVVDQATSEAEGLRRRLGDLTLSDLEPLREALRTLSAADGGDLLGVSTLRGQFADNAEWRDDPARPAVVVGTVDMVGSRLLFSGYGRGFRSRPLHAGFLGQDALLVHDEAHLEPAFQGLACAIESEQQRCREFRKFRVVALTATSRGGGDGEFTLANADREHQELRKRIEARKGIAFYLADDEKDVAGRVCQCALKFRESGQAILIFLRKLDGVADVARKLDKAGLQVEQLTGTMRGYERDAMARANPIFARFLRNASVPPQSGTVYLVCTSAGEVGVDMSADHMVCDLTPFDSMAQRLGRVNRFGGGTASIELVHGPSVGEETSRKLSGAQLEFERARERTLDLLRKLPRGKDGRLDASPWELGCLPSEERQAAFTPAPIVLATSDILFDAWALTSIRGRLPGRPPVADWLHGIADWDPPETYVAWREEVEIVGSELLELQRPDDLLEDYPLKPHELLRDATWRVSKQLEAIGEVHPDLPAWLVESDGSVRVLKISELVPGKTQRLDLADRTVLLPPRAGGLARSGILDSAAQFDEARGEYYDVSGKWLDEQNRPRRCRVWDDERAQPGMRLVRVIDTDPDADDEISEDGPTHARRYWRWYVRPRSADDDGSATASKEQELDSHGKAAGKWARLLVSRLGLAEPEASAVAFAARWHDLGKGRGLWQRSIGNRTERLLAKSGPGMRPIGPCAYRHEFGSLIDIAQLAEFRDLEPDVQDLVLHLIGAHHGRGRPHFSSEEAFDPEFVEETTMKVAREVPGRFARLQRHYGRWGLAYLESLLRAADASVSQNIGRIDPVPGAEASEPSVGKP